MAAPFRLPKPGTELGPCPDLCQHVDCAATRQQAISPCCLCGQTIGYEIPFYYAPNGELVHAACLRARADREASR